MIVLPSGLSAKLSDAEEVARFLTSSSWFAPTTGRVKHQAFLPAPDNDTSVIRIAGRAETALWGDARTNLQGHHFHGAGVVRVGIVRETGLDAIADEPPPFHANLRGWTVDADPEYQKAKRKALAISIAEEARLVLCAE